jgi:D-3-phosphoglycerate dehydrogenase
MRCLIVDDVHPVLIQTLRLEGIDVDYQPEYDHLKEYMEYEVSILVLRSKFFVDSEFLTRFPKLRIIARAGAGLDNIDVEAAAQAGIEVLHAAEGNADAVAEHTIGLMLALLNRFIPADQSVRSGNWKREAYRGKELNQQTVGLLGFGNMGQAVARRLLAFGCKVLSYDKYIESWPEPKVQRVELSELLSESGVLSLHIPLTPETTGMVNPDFLGRCRKGAFFLNTSRGAIVSMEAMVQHMESGAFSGAAFDVFDQEPPPKKGQRNFETYERLFARNDVLLTPHVAGWSTESYEKISAVLGRKILALCRQEIRDERL